RGQEWRPWAHARQERRDSALTRPRPPVPSVALDFLQLHPEAAGVVALVADPGHLRVRGVRRAIDRAGDFPAGSHAQLAQAIARLAAATVLRVMDRGLARIQVDLGVVHYAADEQATDHVAPRCFGPGSSLGPS